MLFHVRDTNAISNAKKDDFKSIYHIEEAVNGLDRAKEGNPALKGRLDKFMTYAAGQEEVLRKKYDWTRSLEGD